MSIFDRFNKVFFLGAGTMAERIYKQNPSLKNKQIGAIDLLDNGQRKIKEFMGASVVNPEMVKEELNREDVAIVVAIGSVCACDICREYITKYAARTDNIIVPNPYTVLRFFCCDEDKSKEEMLPRNAPEYGVVREMFKDEESLSIFDTIMESKVYNGLDDCYELVMYDNISNMYYYSENYGFEKIADASKWNTVLDCGAFIGDSIDDICKEINSDKIIYYAFEPNENNYKVMENDHSLEKLCSKLILENCGVGEKSETLEFAIPKNGDLEGGHVVYSEDGDKRDENVITCKIKAIDDMNLDVIDNLFVKMDIEGAELAALKGAENTIKKYHPVLSICIHHRKNDITQIPLFVKSLGIDYRYYLRGGYHTILLAIPR